ncbi:Vitellogenin 1, partial [Caligus rogercresseyi]
WCCSRASTSFYGWAPSKEYVYHFETQMLNGIPEIRSQYSGLKLSANPPHSDRGAPLRDCESRDPSIDGHLYVPMSNSEELPGIVYKSLVAPFEVHLKRGVVESLFVEKDEPVVVSNLKKAILSQIQTDITGSREGHVQKMNHEVLPLVASGSPQMNN